VISWSNANVKKNNGLQVILQRTFLFQLFYFNKRLMYMYYKNCNYFFKNKTVFVENKLCYEIFCAINKLAIEVLF